MAIRIGLFWHLRIPQGTDAAQEQVGALSLLARRASIGLFCHTNRSLLTLTHTSGHWCSTRASSCSVIARRGRSTRSRRCLYVYVWWCDICVRWCDLGVFICVPAQGGAYMYMHMHMCMYMHMHMHMCMYAYAYVYVYVYVYAYWPTPPSLLYRPLLPCVWWCDICVWWCDICVFICVPLSRQCTLTCAYYCTHFTARVAVAL